MMPHLARNPAIAIVAVLAVAASLSACGAGAGDASTSTASDPGQPLPLAAEEKRLQEHRLVSSGEFAKTRPGSVQRAFYDYWSALENEEWTIALDYYLPEVQRRLRPDALIAALRVEAQSLPVKPLIRSSRAARADQTSIRYFLRRADGKLRSTSMIWRARGGRWYILYSSTLDDSYGYAAQQLAQAAAGDPAASQASKQALAAAARASRAQAAAALRP
jgi:hypothetical protein